MVRVHVPPLFEVGFFGVEGRGMSPSGGAKYAGVEILAQNNRRIQGMKMQERKYMT